MFPKGTFANLNNGIFWVPKSCEAIVEDVRVQTELKVTDTDLLMQKRFY